MPHKKNQQHTSLNFESLYNNQKKMDFFKCIVITSMHQFKNNGAFFGFISNLKVDDSNISYLIVLFYLMCLFFIFLMNSIVVQY